MNGRTQERRKRSRAGRRKERKERKEEEEEDSLYAPISTTGILGLIIQMWMLLLENTRSRVDALSPAQEPKLKSATAKKRKKRKRKSRQTCIKGMWHRHCVVFN